MRKQELFEKVREGAVFIYPTDTIYGIGCNAQDEKAVAKIRRIKQRPTSPLSIWVPSKQWIEENCELSKEQKEEHLSKLPGPFTFIVKLKNKKAVAKNVIPETENIGVRMPDHYLNKALEELDLPIVTTSVNKHGERFMKNLEDLDPDIEREVDFMIYDGEISGRPSKIVNLVTKEVIER